jgi:peptide/nickel transport system substrate-binding protein
MDTKKKLFGRRTAVLLAAVLLAAVAAATLSACGRKEKYPDSLKVGSSEIPKTLMPYVSTSAANIFAVGLLYDTLLRSESEPAGYVEGETYAFEDGKVFEPIDREENYFKFTDGLCEVAGAYEKKPGSDYGWEKFTPTAQQYERQLAFKEIVRGKDQTGNPIDETDAEFEKRAEEAVPKDNWRRYRFKVREGYTWNDGVKFTARDIEFTFKYALRYRGALASIAFFLTNHFDCEAEDDSNFVLTLASNKLSDIKTICNSILIIPEHIWGSIRKPAEEKNVNPVGTGAYRVVSGDYIEDSSLVLTYRDEYDEKLRAEMFAYAPIARISMIKISSQDVLLSAIQAGDIDVSLDAVDEAKAYAIGGNDRYDKVKISTYDSPFVTTLVFNVGRKGAFRADAFNGNGYKVRRAIAYAIDQDRLIQNVRHSNAVKVGGGLVQRWMPHALLDENGSYVEHETNAEKAKQLLDEAGYPVVGGKRDLSFSILAGTGTEPLVHELGNIFRGTLGIEVTFKQSDAQYSEVIKQSNGADFDMIINSVSFDTDQLLMFDARFGVYPNGLPRVFNYSGIIDGALCEQMRQMDIETNIAEQYKKAQAVQKKLTELCVEAPLYSAKAYAAFSEQSYTGWVELKREKVLNAYSYRYLRKKS